MRVTKHFKFWYFGKRRKSKSTPYQKCDVCKLLFPPRKCECTNSSWEQLELKYCKRVSSHYNLQVSCRKTLVTHRIFRFDRSWNYWEGIKFNLLDVLIKTTGNRKFHVGHHKEGDASAPVVTESQSTILKVNKQTIVIQRTSTLLNQGNFFMNSLPMEWISLRFVFSGRCLPFFFFYKLFSFIKK